MLFLLQLSLAMVIDTSQAFQTINVTTTGTYDVTVSGLRVFIFVGQEADEVQVTADGKTVQISAPYAFEVSVAAVILVNTTVPVDMIVVVTGIEWCQNGAYYTTGGLVSTIEAPYNYSTGGPTSYCIFSPASNRKPVTVVFGTTEYDYYQEKAYIVYPDGPGSIMHPCETKNLCSIDLPDAYYFVAFYKSGYLSGDIKYQRTNKEDDGSLACSTRSIPYIPDWSTVYPVPYDIDHGKNECTTAVALGLAVIIVIVVVAVVIVGALIASCLGGCFARCGIKGCVKRDGGDTTSIYGSIANEQSHNTYSNYTYGGGGYSPQAGQYPNYQ